ncbi:hypothetical protein GQ44DRAFT_697855 [Phaeosphaeriaceae sp. PMI808]|nr:hypothetical protein GQ44DRAFT_697855 [Phaeosphaeriaceae sp. PMI808]
MPWATAFQAARNFTSHAATCCRLSLTSFDNKSAAQIHSSMIIVSQVILSFQFIPPGTKNELLGNMWMFRNRVSTLERDKVPSFKFSVGYRSPYVDVCRGSILEDIKASGNLHALKGVRGPKIWKGPSWVTDWSNWDWWAEDRARILSELHHNLYSASGASKPRIAVFSEGKILGVAGEVFDEVDYVSSFTWNKDLKGLIYILGEARSRWSSRNALCVHGGSFSNSFFRVLLADCITSHHASEDVFSTYLPASDIEEFKPQQRRYSPKDWFAFLIWWIWKNQYRVSDHENLSYFDMYKIPAFVTINASLIRALSGRKLFMTTKGYMGLAPEGCEVGDKVTILLGGTTPFMLRPLMSKFSFGQHYALVGDCYVHGCMDGEMIKGAQTDALELLMLE